eukprot:TRINITY_DN38533_c0_g1_i1.p1 TRINITY_DN38533_c0_g1~~TRINITY_DN38533_c0_g1_i1.p1  ORF type:complete len:940 (-),score=252.43 TRINITY_DN38533_c0_g1_i1:1075-3894(-)
MEAEGPIMDEVTPWIPKAGELVWAKVKSHPWWPARVAKLEEASEKARKTQKEDHLLVAFYGDETFKWMTETELLPFAPFLSDFHNQASQKLFHLALQYALDALESGLEKGIRLSSDANDPPPWPTEFSPEEYLAHIRETACTPQEWPKRVMHSTNLRLAYVALRRRTALGSPIPDLHLWMNQALLNDPSPSSTRIRASKTTDGDTSTRKSRPKTPKTPKDPKIPKTPKTPKGDVDTDEEDAAIEGASALTKPKSRKKKKADGKTPSSTASKFTAVTYGKVPGSRAGGTSATKTPSVTNAEGVDKEKVYEWTDEFDFLSTLTPTPPTSTYKRKGTPSSRLADAAKESKVSMEFEKESEKEEPSLRPAKKAKREGVVTKALEDTDKMDGEHEKKRGAKKKKMENGAEETAMKSGKKRGRFKDSPAEGMTTAGGGEKGESGNKSVRKGKRKETGVDEENGVLALPGGKKRAGRKSVAGKVEKSKNGDAEEEEEEEGVEEIEEREEGVNGDGVEKERKRAGEWRLRRHQTEKAVSLSEGRDDDGGSEASRAGIGLSGKPSLQSSRKITPSGKKLVATVDTDAETEDDEDVADDDDKVDTFDFDDTDADEANLVDDDDDEYFECSPAVKKAAADKKARKRSTETRAKKEKEEASKLTKSAKKSKLGSKAGSSSGSKRAISIADLPRTRLNNQSASSPSRLKEGNPKSEVFGGASELRTKALHDPANPLIVPSSEVFGGTSELRTKALHDPASPLNVPSSEVFGGTSELRTKALHDPASRRPSLSMISTPPTALGSVDGGKVASEGKEGSGKEKAGPSGAAVLAKGKGEKGKAGVSSVGKITAGRKEKSRAAASDSGSHGATGLPSQPAKSVKVKSALLDDGPFAFPDDDEEDEDDDETDDEAEKFTMKAVSTIPAMETKEAATMTAPSGADELPKRRSQRKGAA